MTYTWAGNAASGNAYRVRPINALNGYVNFEPTNPRPTSAPACRWHAESRRHEPAQLLQHLRRHARPVAAAPAARPPIVAAQTCQAEFDRQWPKTVAAILAMNA